jgi:sulfoquinovosidase
MARVYRTSHMITIESTAEGFSLAVDGRKVLAHSRRQGCVELGVAENLVKGGKGRWKLRSRRVIEAPLRAFKVVESSGELVVIDFDGKLTMAVRQEPSRVRLSFSRFDSSINHFRLRLAAEADERVFGCGERSGRLDAKGRRVELWVRDGAGGDESSTPYPIPAFVSTDDSWCVADCSAYASFDFRRNATVFDSWAVPRELVLGRRETAAQAVSDMGSFLGPQPPPPDWAFEGAWIELRGGTEAARDRVDAAQAAGIALAAVWSRDWSGGASAAMRDLSYDRGSYEGLPAEIAALRARGVRFLGSASPLLDPSGPLYAEASAAGYCVKDAAFLDLTNPEAAEWLKGLMARGMLDLGMSGWLAEGGGSLPADSALASGESGAAAHNRWPLLWARACREAIDEPGVGRVRDPMLLVDSGWLGSARYANAFWPGERAAAPPRREGPTASVPAALSLGLSGGGAWHYEVADRPSRPLSCPELLARQAETAAFSPLLRIGEGRGGDRKSWPWGDPEGLEFLARISRVYSGLKPYHVAVAAQQAVGLPPIRHPWMHYEADPRARRLAYQYLYGRDLMVAPAASAKSSLTELYLPEDDWVHLWSSRSFRGGAVAVESPIGYPAVFYRASSPFASLFDALRRTTRRG